MTAKVLTTQESLLFSSPNLTSCLHYSANYSSAYVFETGTLECLSLELRILPEKIYIVFHTLPGEEEGAETKLIVPHITKRETEAQRNLVQVHTSCLIQGVLLLSSVSRRKDWEAAAARHSPGQAMCPGPGMSSTGSCPLWECWEALWI